MSRILSAVIFLLLFPLHVSAHDFWLEPSKFDAGEDERVGVNFVVGEKYVGRSVARNPRKLKRFIVKSSKGEQELEGRSGESPAGHFRTEGADLFVIGYQNHPSSVTLPTKKFLNYVEKEGMSHLVDRSPEATGKVSEFFARSAKSLVRVGPVLNAEHLTKPLGLTLELIPAKSPFGVIEKLPVTLLFNGKPVENSLIVVLKKSDPEKAFKVRTDKDGKADVPISPEEEFLIKTVHIEPAGERGGDYYSFWASLSFRTPANG